MHLIVFFNVNNTQFTKIDTSGLIVFHAARETIFPYYNDGWYNIGDRLFKLYHFLEDSPEILLILMLHIIKLLELENKHYKQILLSMSDTMSIISRYTIFNFRYSGLTTFR
jgi:hypothetical protein